MSICKLEEVKSFFSNDDSLDINDEQVEEYFNMISNPCNRIKTADEIWVACGDKKENTTVNIAIKKITGKIDNIYDKIDEACEDFKQYKNKKPRIPFYVWVLHLIS